MTYKCDRCRDTGVYETGNNDFPCSCPRGLTAKFNVCGVAGPITGAQMRAQQPGGQFVTDLIDQKPPKKKEAVPVEPTENRSGMHELKCHPQFFKAVDRGDKTFECRKDDRGFQEGDHLFLREWNPVTITQQNKESRVIGYTGSTLVVEVTYLLRRFEGLKEGWVIMGIKVLRVDA